MKKGILLIVALLLIGCQPPQFVKDGAAKYRKEQNKKNELTKVFNNEYKIKKNEEVKCLLVSNSFDAKAYCHNKSNSIRFYSDFRSLKSKYKILHKNNIDYSHRTSRDALQSGEIANIELWATKK